MRKAILRLVPPAIGPIAPPSWFRRLDGFQIRAVLHLVFVLALATAALATPGFLSGPALQSLLTTISFIGCVAVGMTLVTISGNILTLSLGATVGASALVAIAAANRSGLAGAVPIALMFGALVGAIQGALIGYLRANPIIVTVATSVLIYGAAQPITGNAAFYAVHPTPDSLLNARLFGLPIEFIVFVAILLICQFLLSFTVFGRNVLMVGSSFNAARAAGLRPWATIIGAYSCAGLFSAIAGVMLALRYGRASMEFGLGYDYSAIAAVLVGGTAISGGQGSAIRTFAGMMIIGIVQVVLLLHGFRQEWQYLITGVIVLGIVMLSPPARR
jgi:ribose/xylose/arabinose/galactoside ABC-type transport system permease subunit